MASCASSCSASETPVLPVLPGDTLDKEEVPTQEGLGTSSSSASDVKLDKSLNHP